VTTNPRDTIADALTDPDVPNDTRRLIAEHEADGALALLAERGFVVVACPPGSRVVVSRESKPCETCMGDGMVLIELPGYGHRKCSACGGSGVVEATTIHGLAEVRLGWIDEDGAERPLHPFAVERMLYDETLYRMIALPEETP